MNLVITSFFVRHIPYKSCILIYTLTLFVLCRVSFIRRPPHNLTISLIVHFTRNISFLLFQGPQVNKTKDPYIIFPHAPVCPSILFLPEGTAKSRSFCNSTYFSKVQRCTFVLLRDDYAYTQFQFTSQEPSTANMTLRRQREGGVTRNEHCTADAVGAQGWR